LREEGNSSKALESMERLGWLKDYETVPGRMGRKKYTHIGGSVMLNADGSTVNMLEMFGQFAKAWERYKDLPNARALFQADMFKVLGEQGQKTALLVSQNYDVIMQMIEDAERVKPIHEQIDEYSKEYLQNYKAFKEAIGNFERDAGNTLLPSGTETLKTLREWIMNIREFTAAHPGLVSGVMKFLLVMGALKIGVGAVQIVSGTLLTTYGGLKTAFGWLISGGGKALKAISNLKTGFDLFRATGAGFWRSLWKGAQLAWPWLGKISGWVLRFTPMWLVNAARIGAGWLIAIGPLGWITLAIIAAIAAWQTNFLGFRDFVKGVWDKTVEWAKTAFEWVSKYFDKLMEALGMAEKVKNAQEKAREYGYTTPGGVADTLPDADSAPLVPQARTNVNSTITQNNNITVATHKEGAEFVQKAKPGKYSNNDFNPAWGT